MRPYVTMYISYLFVSLSDVCALRLSQTPNEPIMFTMPESLRCSQCELRENLENA